MTEAPLTPREEDEALAAEYVLGVLGLPDRVAVARRIRDDAQFAGLVAHWEHRLAGLNDGFEPVEPPPQLLTGIEARLFPTPERQSRFSLRAFGGWLGGSLVAATLVIGMLTLAPPPAPTGTVVAELGSTETGLAYEARYDGQNLQVTRVAGVRPGADQDHELWIIAPGAAPVSLGLLRDEPLTVEYPPPPAGWVLAVSVEPAGGSPTGAPTGPVILTAEISA